MTALEGFDDNYDPAKETRYHYAAKSTNVLALMILASIPASYYLDLGDNLTFNIFYYTFLVACVVFSLTYARRHKPGLCVRCTRKTIVSLNEAAARNRKWFRMFHTYDDIMHSLTHAVRLCRFRIIAGVAWFLPAIVVGAGLGWLIGPPWTVFAQLGVLAASLYPVAIHMKYQLFCPWCRRRGNDDDNEIEPVPDPAHGATV